MKYLKNKALWSFVGGALTFTVGKEIVTSRKAKKLYANCLAKGLKLNDDLRTTYEDVKEEALDIYFEAQDIKRQEQLIEENDD